MIRLWCSHSGTMKLIFFNLSSLTPLMDLLSYGTSFHWWWVSYRQTLI